MTPTQTTPQFIHIVGAGLAGTECALQLASRGYKVHLYEMRDSVMTPAHQTSAFAELVCSNSFGSDSEVSAPGELKHEAFLMGSFVLKAAQLSRVPAGQALAVDRHLFSQTLTQWVHENPNIQVHREVVTSLESIPEPLVIATGPLTHPLLAEKIQALLGGEFLYFFDAIALIIDADSINMDIAWYADRYDKGTPDYINCPMNKDQYNRFIQEIQLAKKIEPKHFETTDFFEGCMPIEVMVERGPQTLRFGPMKPVGLINPKEGREPWAVVQLRQDNKEKTAFNMVGFQTRMTYSEQARIFRMIPGLENAEFLKLGSIHRNLFINSPACLNPDLSSKIKPQLYFAGQMTGVEGYFESTCTGLLVAHSLHQKFSPNTHSLSASPPPRASAMGSLVESITSPDRAKNFQPTNINFGLFPPLAEKDKKKKKELQVLKAKESFLSWLEATGSNSAT